MIITGEVWGCVGGCLPVHAELHAVRKALLAGRGLAAPDGRPLYRYRFGRAEYEAVGARLRAFGAIGLAGRDGAALFVAFVAEWFRRDRAGGHWDWIRPLAALGIRYDSQDLSADLTYPQVRDAVARGLAAWTRPAPADGEWILAIVREAGFPAAATRVDPRLSSWLKRSVLAIERGFPAHEAVELESWRASERIVRALFEAAVTLCTSIVELRAAIPAAERAEDPVARLDARRAGWRSTLPFDVEARDVAALVEEVLRVRADRSDALRTTRRLVRRDVGWQARATLGLSGLIDDSRMPAGLRERLGGLGRLRLVSRGELADLARPFAAMEWDRAEEGGGWEVRPLVSTFDRVLPLHVDLRIGALTAEHVAVEFTAFGGEGLDAGAVVLEPIAGEEPEKAMELSVLGAGSVRSRASWLALALSPEHLPRVEFSERLADLGGIEGSDLVVVAFRDRATLELDGMRRVWQAGSDDDRKDRLVLVGETLRGVREQVFIGVPRFFIEHEGNFRTAPVTAIRWRPRRRGAWRPLDGDGPVGRIDFALSLDGDVIDNVAAAVAPSGMHLRGRIEPRALIVDGLGEAKIAARGAGPLPVELAESRAVVDLTRLAPGGRLTLEIQAEGRLDLTLDDPSASEVLVTPRNEIAPRRTRLAVGRLHGYCLLAAQGGRLRFELDPSGGGGHFTRKVDGTVPLGAFDEEIRSMLGGAERLDVDVRLTWLGQADRAAEIGWYERVERRRNEVHSEAPVRRSAFALLRPQDGILEDAPIANAPGTADALRPSLGSGPWLVYATGGDGEVLRPRLVRDPAAPMEGLLAEAVSVALQLDRNRAFDNLLRGPGAEESDLLRWFVNLLVLARRIGLPLIALDGATALCRNPAAATRALALCDSIEERAAVLALQRDLSFLWCTTPLADWVAAFAARRDGVAERLAAVDIEASEAVRYVLAALAEIADLNSGTAAHVRLTFLLEVHGRVPVGRPPLDDNLVRRLMRGVPEAQPGEMLRALAGEVVARRVDMDLPPRNLRLAGVVADGAEVVAGVNPHFRDVAAAPYVAAALAAGLPDPDGTLRRRCREAWLFDPDYFNRATSIALARLAGGVTARSVEIAR